MHIEGVDEAALNAFGDVEKGGVFEVFLSLGIKLMFHLWKSLRARRTAFGIGEVAGDENLNQAMASSHLRTLSTCCSSSSGRFL